MSGEVVTKDLGNGYYMHTYNVETYYSTETITGPAPSSALEKAKPPHSSPLGPYQPYSLKQFVEEKDSGAVRGEVVELAHVEKDRLVVNEQALKIFKRYPEYEISFVGNYGRLNSGKSFWYDKILNLSQFDGNNYSSNKRQQGIYFWSVPFSKGRLKFFLLDYVGFKAQQNLTRHDQILLDLQLLLAEKFVVVPEPHDDQLTVLPAAYKHLLESQERFSDKGVTANKFSPFWPNQIYTLYRSSRPVRKQIDNIGTLFEVYNFSIIHDAMAAGEHNPEDLKKSTMLAGEGAPLNEKYVRMTSVVFQDIYEKMKGKQYSGVTFNGENLSRVMQQAATTINNGQGVKVDEIFKGVKKDISEDTYTRSKMLFMREVDAIRSKKEPQPLDDIIERFDRGNKAAFGYFDSVKMNIPDKNRLETQLREDFDRIEQEVVQENKQKTYLHYSQLLSPQNNDTQQAYQSLKTTFIADKNAHHLDHDDTLPVAQQLQYIATGHQPKEVAVLRIKISEKEKELEEIGQRDRPVVLPVDQQRMAQTRDILTSKTINLRQNLEEEKQLYRMDPREKELELERLRQKHAEGEKWLSQVGQEGSRRGEVDALREKLRKMKQRNRQHEEGVSSLQKSFLSQKSNRSVIRDVKNEYIKKTVIK